VFSPGSAETVGWGGKLNGRLMASCVRNIPTKIYQNLVIGFQVTNGMVTLSTMLYLHRVLQRVIPACRCSIDAARALRRELAFWNQKSDAVGILCNGKGIQSVYFWYNSNISKCKRSLFARCRTSSTPLETSSLEHYVDANSSRWRRSFITFAQFKLFYSIKITLATPKINKYWQIIILLSQLALYNSYVKWCNLDFSDVKRLSYIRKTLCRLSELWVSSRLFDIFFISSKLFYTLTQ